MSEGIGSGPMEGGGKKAEGEVGRRRKIRKKEKRWDEGGKRREAIPV